MKFQFNEKKVKLPEAVHAYAEKKVGKLDRWSLFPLKRTATRWR